MLAEIVPVILTWNEAANIGRVLEALRWARRVVVLDSGSSDATRAIAAGFANVDWRERAFDSHAMQCNYALEHLVADAAWVLFMDADYVLTPALREEIFALDPSSEISGYRIRFRYCIDGQPLSGTLYPPRVSLFRPERGRYVQEGHAHVLSIPGLVIDLHAAILHDDRKPRARFLANQRKYARLEADWLRQQPWSQLRLADRIRRLIVIAPWLAPLFAYTVRGVWRDGRLGLRYIGERALAEFLIANELLRRRPKPAADRDTAR